MSIFDLETPKALPTRGRDVRLGHFVTHTGASEACDQSRARQRECDGWQDQVLDIAGATNRQKSEIVAHQENQDQAQPEVGNRN